MNLAPLVLIGVISWKLPAIEVNPAMPNLANQAKPKSVKQTFEGTNVSMPAPPSKRYLTELDSMVEHGESRGKLGQQAHSRKFTLVDLPTLVELTRVKFMRLHSRKTFLAGKKYKYRYPCCYTYINETFLMGKKYNYRLCRKWPVATRQVVCTYTGHQ